MQNLRTTKKHTTSTKRQSRQHNRNCGTQSHDEKTHHEFNANVINLKKKHDEIGDENADVKFMMECNHEIAMTTFEKRTSKLKPTQ